MARRAPRERVSHRFQWPTRSATRCVRRTSRSAVEQSPSPSVPTPTRGCVPATPPRRVHRGPGRRAVLQHRLPYPPWHRSGPMTWRETALSPRRGPWGRGRLSLDVSFRVLVVHARASSRAGRYKATDSDGGMSTVAAAGSMPIAKTAPPRPTVASVPKDLTSIAKWMTRGLRLNALGARRGPRLGGGGPRHFFRLPDASRHCADARLLGSARYRIHSFPRTNRRGPSPARQTHPHHAA